MISGVMVGHRGGSDDEGGNRSRSQGRNCDRISVCCASTVTSTASSSTNSTSTGKPGDALAQHLEQRAQAPKSSMISGEPAAREPGNVVAQVLDDALRHVCAQQGGEDARVTLAAIRSSSLGEAGSRAPRRDAQIHWPGNRRWLSTPRCCMAACSRAKISASSARAVAAPSRRPRS